MQNSACQRKVLRPHAAAFRGHDQMRKNERRQASTWLCKNRMNLMPELNKHAPLYCPQQPAMDCSTVCAQTSLSRYVWGILCLTQASVKLQGATEKSSFSPTYSPPNLPTPRSTLQHIAATSWHHVNPPSRKDECRCG